MVLILLSSPSPLSPLLPYSPRSKDLSPLSPRTPLTPSPSFFAILSPIFTADDAPQSPGPRQLSPGTIPPETPPPWLLAPQSPASPLRPTAVRQPSTESKRQFSLPRLTTGEGLTNSPRTLSRSQRPGLPSITHSFSSGSAQQFRPPPPASLKRINTAPVNVKQPTSPLNRSWKAVSTAISEQKVSDKQGSRPNLSRAVTSGPVPSLSVRPPSRENTIELESPDEDTLGAEEARRLSVAVMGVDNGLGSGFEGTTAEEESMEIPIALELEQPSSKIPAEKLASTRPRPTTLFRPVPRTVTELRGPHSRSQSLEITSAPRPKPIVTNIVAPIQLMASPRTPKDSEAKRWHRASLSPASLGPLGKLAVAAAQQS
ncbi:Serine/threonine-protein kinase wnk4 [Thelotrema lepadinum]|nr:Serine/threonine-protein kinase wnk4 [Thelotrema lepadinum]